MSERKQCLVVVVPSISDRTEPWDGLVARLQTLPGYGEDTAEWFRPHHGGGWFRRGSVAKLGSKMAARINEKWVANGGYESVVLVGHSLGGLVVRYAYMEGKGAFQRSDERDWAKAVERVVLFASLNRGLDLEKRWWLPLVAWAGRVIPGMRSWMAHDVLRGSAFLTNLRIAWVRTVNDMERPPVLVQFLGDTDDLVDADDSKDIDTFPTGTQETIADATHRNLISLDTAPDPEARFELIAKAFTRERPQHVDGVGDPDKRVVIVLHGIRASNDTWPTELEKHIEATWPGTEVIPATYDYFSAWKFMIPASRRKFLWFMQQTYADQLAANPRAIFHFVGHSNGTYLLGHSLERIPAMRFERILLAGSVLPSTYDWETRHRVSQFEQLSNHRSAADVPVGVLCAALRALFMRDIGTAGLKGFRWPGLQGQKFEVFYYDGGHSAAVAIDNLPKLARFVMDGTSESPDKRVPSPTKGFSLLSRAAPFLSWLLGLGLLSGAATFVALGSLGVALNLIVLAVALFVVYVVLDIL